MDNFKIHIPCWIRHSLLVKSLYEVVAKFTSDRTAVVVFEPREADREWEGGEANIEGEVQRDPQDEEHEGPQISKGRRLGLELHNYQELYDRLKRRELERFANGREFTYAKFLLARLGKTTVTSFRI
ncbi:hypothetical protein Pyn_35260 [Prunus yedoensis var. nudiflora]|uniref:Uncharacterized protein n=1 Tax=Prunus yedoensis var. nudiflora TaxID=2094558 RepID=A0A314ZAZ6_PRUYE|nr:hypothetical protein Pyn_35260 [Prunus yedoensis var. nudiflora]